MTVSLEVAKALKAAGLPQDQWPQMVWALARDETTWLLRYWDDEVAKFVHLTEWYPAPDALTALMWLEVEKDIQWCKSIKRVGGEWRYVGWHTDEDFTVPTPEALILAICERLKA